MGDRDYVMPALSLDDLRLGLIRPGTRMGRNPFSSLSWSGTESAENQIDSVINPILQARSDAFRNKIFNAQNFFNPAAISNYKSSPFGTTTGFIKPLPITPASGAPSTTENEFGQKLARLSKSPRFDTITDNFLAELEQYKPTAATVAARNLAANQVGQAGEVGGRIRELQRQNIDRTVTDQAANKVALDAFMERFSAAVPGLDESTAAQTSRLNTFFAPASDPSSLAAQQAAIRGRAAEAETGALLPGIERALLASQLRGGVEGTRRVNDINLKNTALQLYRDAAVRNSARESADLANLTALQRGTAGLPQQVATTNLLAGRIPIDTRLDVMGRELGISGDALRSALAGEGATTANIGAALNIDQATDPLTNLARRMGLSGQALNQFLANNFLEVATPGPDFTPGVGFPRLPQGNFQPPEDIGDVDLSELMDFYGGGRPSPRPATAPTYRPQSGRDYGSFPDASGYIKNPDGSYNISSSGNPYQYKTVPGFNAPNPLYYPGQLQNTELLQDYYENPEKYGYVNPVTESAF